MITLALRGGICVSTLAELLPHSANAMAQQRDASAALVFDNVTVIDVEHGTRIPHRRVVIIGDHIRAIGIADSVPVPSGAHVVNANGKYLIPGLWDMHTHSRTATAIFYPLFLANGVTGIRDAWSEIPLDTLNRWRREILAERRVGPPRQILSGPGSTRLFPARESRTRGTFVSPALPTLAM